MICNTGSLNASQTRKIPLAPDDSSKGFAVGGVCGDYGISQRMADTISIMSGLRVDKFFLHEPECCWSYMCHLHLRQKRGLRRA